MSGDPSAFGKIFKPKPGRFGTHPAFLEWQTSAASPLTASATTTIYVPTPVRKLRIARCATFSSTVGITAGGTLLATVKILATDGTTKRAVTGAFDLATLTAKVLSQIPLLSTATEATLQIAEGETIIVDVVSNAAIGTQPVDLQFNLEVFIRE